MPREGTSRRGLRGLVATVSAGLILVVGVGVPTAIIAPVPSASAEVSAQTTSTTLAAAPVLPDFGSSAIGAVELPGVLATHGPQSPRRIASITKVVTALVVLQAKPVGAGEAGPTITFGQRDVGYLYDVQAQNGTFEAVQPGWRMHERAAIETMLIPSANNYAESLAVWAYGSVPRFLAAARTYLKEHGLDHTVLHDTNGLSADNRSTPADLVALGRIALRNDVVADAVKQRSATEPHVGALDNTNKLLGRYGVDGLKTGTYDGGANLLFSATVTVDGRPVRLVGVVLGARTHELLDARVPAMLRSVRKGLHDLALATAGQAFATYRTKWGGTCMAVAATSARRLVWGSARVAQTADVRPITGGQKGERVGTVVFRLHGRSITVPLVLDRDVLAAPVWWRLTHPLR